MKSLAIVIGKAKKGSEPPESSEDMGGEEESEGGEAREAADLAFDAVKNGDKEAFYEALKSFHASCGAE